MDIKDKILKLLAKADNTACTVEEAKAFNEKAHALMQQHNLTRAELKPAERKTTRTHMTLQVLKRPWSSWILHGVCSLYHCKWFFTQNKTNKRGPDTITIVGEQSNCAVAHAVSVMILRAVQHEARRAGGGRSFMSGAAEVIWRRCKELTEGNAIAKDPDALRLTSDQSRALVVLTEDEQKANAEYILNLVGGKLKQARRSTARVNSSQALEAGRRYGASVNLRGNLLGAD